MPGYELIDQKEYKQISTIFKKSKTLFRMGFEKQRKGIFKVVEFEKKLRVAGLYEEYEKRIINSDIDGFIDNFKSYVEDQLTISNNSFITEQGDVEKWDGGLNKKRVLEALDKTIEHLEKMKK